MNLRIKSWSQLDPSILSKNRNNKTWLNICCRHIKTMHDSCWTPIIFHRNGKGEAGPYCCITWWPFPWEAQHRHLYPSEKKNQWQTKVMITPKFNFVNLNQWVFTGITNRNMNDRTRLTQIKQLCHPKAHPQHRWQFMKAITLEPSAQPAGCSPQSKNMFSLQLV